MQSPQKTPQDLQSSAMMMMMMMMAPPSATSTTQHLVYGNSSENPKESSVSTTLCLSSCEEPKKRKRNHDDPAAKVSCSPSDNNYLTKKERKTNRMGTNLSSEERERDERYGVSTELTLFKDPWILKKVLTPSDLGPLSRLLLHTRPMEEHLIKYLNKDDQIKVHQGLGITVDVYDHDTDSTFQLLLKRWTTLNGYVLNGGWRMHLVRKRCLRKGDEIGLLWDRFASRLHFRVLSRAQEP